MKIHAPSETVYWAGVVLIVLALIGHFVPDATFLTEYQFWIAVTSSIVLLLGCIV